MLVLRARKHVSSLRPPTFSRWVGQPNGLEVQRLQRGDEERKPLREESVQQRQRRRLCHHSILRAKTRRLGAPPITPVSKKQRFRFPRARTSTVRLGCADFFERNFRLRISSRPSFESSRAEASNEPSSAFRRAHSGKLCSSHGRQVVRSSLQKQVVRCSSRRIQLVKTTLDLNSNNYELLHKGTTNLYCLRQAPGDSDIP